jgi:tetratricopeptide (TPR) repeat protein
MLNKLKYGLLLIVFTFCFIAGVRECFRDVFGVKTYSLDIQRDSIMYNYTLRLIDKYYLENNPDRMLYEINNLKKFERYEEDFQFFNRLGKYYILKKDWELALENFKYSLKLLYNTESDFNCGLCYQKLGFNMNAAKHYKRVAEKLNYEDQESIYFSMLCFYYVGDDKSVCDMYKHFKDDGTYVYKIKYFKRLCDYCFL